MEEKKKRKIFVAVFSVLCCLAIGAIATIWSTVGSGQKQEVEPGEITPITFEEVQDKMDSKETFTLIITQSDCMHCQDFYDMMGNDLPKHSIELFDLNIDRETPEEEEQIKKEIQEIFLGYVGTPNMFYIEKGNIISQYDNITSDITEQSFNAWVQKYHMDQV